MLESKATETRTLTMRFTMTSEIKAVIRPGAGGVGYAINEATRYLDGCTNVDPGSVRFSIDEDGARDACAVRTY